MYTINIIEYYLNLAVTWASQYVMYLYNQFMGFAPIIKVAAISVTFSVGLILFTILKMLFNGMRNRKWRKQYKKLDKKYGDAIKYIISPESKENMSRQEIMDTLDLDERERKDSANILKTNREKFCFARLVYSYVIDDEASLERHKNLHILLDVFNMPHYLEDVVNIGKMRRKAEALVMMRAFKLTVNQWIANQFRNSKRYRLRRLSMYASIMSSSNSDLEYFESDFFDKNCCIYDEIQLGYALQRRKSQKRKMPNLAQLAASQSSPSTQAVFVRLMRQFEQADYCADLEEIFNSTNDKELVQEICRTWGYLKYLPSEEMMQDIILTQQDETKVTIMHALARLKTGKSLNVFVDGYRNSGDQHVRYEALRCMYNYGQPGYTKFKELEAQAPEIDKRIFDFFNNPLTRDDTKLSKDDVYESQGGENLYSVV